MSITNVRAGRLVAILLGLQGSKGVPVVDFNSSSSGRIWTREGKAAIAPDKSDPSGWMTQPQMETSGRYNLETARRGRLATQATPTSIEWILRSCWGALTGGRFILSEGISEWLSIGLVESVLSGSPQYLYRLHDAWIHSLTLRSTPFEPLSIEADYAAESDTAPIALDDLGGILLPSLPMPISDMNVFPGRLMRVIRDPGGADEEITCSVVQISIDQGLGSEWDQLRGVQSVFKRGYPGPRVQLHIEGRVSAETWEVISRSRAGAKQSFRVEFVAQSPALTLAFLLTEMDFEVDRIGHSNLQYVPFVGIGQAHRTDGGDFTSILLS